MFKSIQNCAAKILQRIGIVFLGLVIIAIAAPLLLSAAILAPGPLSTSKTLVIPYGASVHTVADLLADNGVIYSSVAFRIAARLSAENVLKAGEYQFTPGQSAAALVQMMHNGQSIMHWFTVAEGLTSAEIVGTLQNTPALSGDVTAVPAEGSLLPETYRYSFGDTRAALLARMQKAMLTALGAAWDKRDADLPLQSPMQALIMASVIEKETGKPQERPRIAGVFYNRLAQHMKLQSDPTVIYALTAGRGTLNRELTHEDLALASPYNTYVNDGLPPAPICNPGAAAIAAALHPEHNDFFYFVADGSGGHAFAHDLAQHNQNVNKWLQSNKNKTLGAPAASVKP